MACRTTAHTAVEGTISSKCPASSRISRCTSSCCSATIIYGVMYSRARAYLSEASQVVLYLSTSPVQEQYHRVGTR